MTWKPDYATGAELLSYLRVNAAQDTENVATFAAQWVTAVSRNIDDFCGRQFGKSDAPVAREYEATWNLKRCKWVAQIDDLYATAGLAIVTAAAVAVTSYKLRPVNALADGEVYTEVELPGCGPYTITSGSWGWSAPPSPLKVGMFLQGARLAARRDSPFGISGSPQEQGEIRLLAQLDPDFRTTLRPFSRKWWAA